MVNDFSTQHSFNLIQFLNAGDTVLFAIGYGPNANDTHDGTGLVANVSPVPEPGTLTLLATGLLLGLARRFHSY